MTCILPLRRAPCKRRRKKCVTALQFGRTAIANRGCLRENQCSWWPRRRGERGRRKKMRKRGGVERDLRASNTTAEAK
jgi:hypothetical protein